MRMSSVFLNYFKFIGRMSLCHMESGGGMLKNHVISTPPYDDDWFKSFSLFGGLNALRPFSLLSPRWVRAFYSIFSIILY